MTIAEIQLIQAAENSDEKILTGYVTVPDNVTDADEWAEEIHQQFRELLLGDLQPDILYFGHWIGISVQLPGHYANTTIHEFLEKAKNHMIEEHGQPTRKRWSYQYWR